MNLEKVNKDSIQKVKKEVDKAQNILLHCHPSPDPDSVGSTLAMKLVLEGLDKKVTLIQGDSDIPKAFAFPAVETITKKSYSEVNIDEFDLFLILDTASIDRVSTKEEINFPEGLMTVVIDHHASNMGYGKINIVDPRYSSTTHILYDVFEGWGVKVDHDIALNLLIGMYTDTGGFRYSNTTADTLRVASELVSLAPDYHKTILFMENSNTKERLVFDKLVLNNIKEYCNGKLVINTITYDELLKNNIKKSDYAGASPANRIISVAGYDIGISIIEEEKDVIKMSFRTRDSEKYDVSKLAVALGGGGHKAAAGARAHMTIDEVIDKVVKTAKELYNL